MNKKLKLTLSILGITFSIYLLSYLALRGKGQYVIIQSGKLRANVLASADKIQWNPSNSHWQTFKTVGGDYKTKGNLKGYFYSPIIIFERFIFKPTHDFTVENAGKLNANWPNY